MFGGLPRRAITVSRQGSWRKATAFRAVRGGQPLEAGEERLGGVAAGRGGLTGR